MIQYLLVRSGDGYYGVGTHQVLSVIDGFELYPAPSAHPAVRGVTPIRDRLVPLIDLAGILTEGQVHATQSETIVLAQTRNALIALHVDDACEVVSGTIEPVPGAWRLPWAAGVHEHEEKLVPIVDIEMLVDRLVPVSAREIV